MDFVTIEKEGRIATVRFDRGNRANALSRQLMEELTEAARALEDDTDLSAVILTGRADVFTLGADLKEVTGVAGAGDAGLAQHLVALKAGHRLCEAWERVDAFTIAAIEGWCVGGGAALAASCDLRIMAEDATIYVPEVERGMNMSWGSVPRFVALIGPARTKRLVALCEKADAETALAWGLVDDVVPKGGAVAAARAIGERAAALPPIAFRAATVVGFFGAGGMGWYLKRNVLQIETQRVAAILLSIVVLVMISEAVSAVARARVAKAK